MRKPVRYGWEISSGILFSSSTRPRVKRSCQRSRAIVGKLSHRQSKTVSHVPGGNTNALAGVVVECCMTSRQCSARKTELWIAGYAHRFPIGARPILIVEVG